MVYNNQYKSRGEEKIAGFLEDYNIDFQYEYPLAIMDRDKLRVWYPDFRLPEYGMIIEYFGMTGDDAYNQQTFHKIKTYQKAGVNGVYLLESSLRGNWQQDVLEMMENSLEDRLRSIGQKRKLYDQGFPVNQDREVCPARPARSYQE